MIDLIDFINEAKEDVKLPYTFDLYNEGPKNKNYWMGKKFIYNTFFDLEDNHKEHYSQDILLPLSADKLYYKEKPTASSTDNWTKIPEIETHMSAGAWYSDKWVEYNYKQYQRDWNDWFAMIKPYMKGKISVTINKSNEVDIVEWAKLEISVNDKKFNQDIADKIKEMTDPQLLKDWKDKADKEEQARLERLQKEQEKRQREEEARQKRVEAYNKWWNSLTPEQQKAEITYRAMGYGQGRYMGD